MKKMSKPIHFTKGPVFSSALELMSWIESNCQDQYIKIPVFIADSSLLNTKIYLGMSSEDIEITVDDTRLGIPLVTQLTALIERSLRFCWLEGYWGKSLLPFLEDNRPVFTAVKLSEEQPLKSHKEYYAYTNAL